MLQVIQNYNNGELKVDNVPPPALQAGGILVKNMFSLISAGTERTTVETAQKSLIGKAQSRPDLVKKVINTAKRDGLMTTIQLVKNKLDTPVPLGYSSSGIVVAVAENVNDFAVGDRVACAGQGYASHADVIFVPQNLAAKVPESVQLDEAAYSTLGAIAMQGVRQAEVSIGENVVVVGLGLIGLITVQILKAAGCRVIGLDISEDACKTASSLGADYTILASDNYMPIIEKSTDGYGVDCAIVTAATPTNEPIVLSGEILRNKGKLIIVGGVPADIPRSPFYEKEIDVRFSRSYGPGRYDIFYEERGIDYPYGYVRWTENRNMISFLNLIAAKKIDLQSITTHRFKIEDAEDAYNLISGKSKKRERYIGILLTYTHRHEIQAETIIPITDYNRSPSEGKVKIGFIGAGNFAQNYLLPILKKNKKRVELVSVSTSRGVTASNVAKKFKFLSATTDNNEILNQTDIDCVFVATRHNLHAPYVIEGIKRGKSIFVEKPLALSVEQLNQVIEAYQEFNGRVMVGFNRRFAPTIVETKKFFDKKIQPVTITYRINAGFVPKEHWTQDPIEGGGRIIGEVCHFVDLLMFLTGSLPIKVYADTISITRDDMMSKDNISITFKFRDGSIGHIIYTASGDRTFPKERIEMFCENSIAVIDDFKQVTFSRHGKVKTFGGSKQDKGYHSALEHFIKSIESGNDSPIPFRDSVNATIATFKILESINTGLPVEIQLDERQDFLMGLSRIHTEHLRA
ncbi:bi-domain-containing oxidoreductase [bacterium]|nr:bi-domain-containing oxidoreductase [bacterium]